MGDQGRKGAAAAAATAADDGTIRLLMLCRPGKPLKAAAPVGMRKCSAAVKVAPPVGVVVGTVVLAVLMILAARSSDGVDVRSGRLGVVGVPGLTVAALCGEAGRLPALPRPLLLPLLLVVSVRALCLAGVRSTAGWLCVVVMSVAVVGVVAGAGAAVGGVALHDLRRCCAGGGVGDGVPLRFSATLRPFEFTSVTRAKKVQTMRG